jgi:hypothetical protein
MRKLAGL